MAPVREENTNPFAGPWRFLSSIRLSVVLFFTLGLAAVIGTLIPQNQKMETYLDAYGRMGYALIDALSLHDIYHAGWFRFILIMLSVNITVCSIHRLNRTWKVVFPENKRLSFRRIEKTGVIESFDIDLSPSEAAARWTDSLRSGFGRFTTEQDDAEVRMVSEKWRLNRLGAHMVHLSVLLMLIGGLVGSILGFDGSVRIPEGEVRDRIRLHGGGVLPLGFEIRCDAFSVSFYEGIGGGKRPREYRSSLTILENGQEAVRKDIVVNDPLRYRGVGIFQSSYGRLPPGDMNLEVIRLDPRETFNLKAATGKPVDLPDDMGVLTIDEFRDHYMLGEHNIGETFIATLTPTDQPAVNVVIPYPFPDIDPEDPILNILSTPLAPRPGQGVSLTFTSTSSRMVFRRTMALGEAHELPENLGVFELREFTPAYEFMGHEMGPAYIGRLTSAEGEVEDVVLPVRFARFDKMRQGPVAIAVEKEIGTAADTGLVIRVGDYQERYYTGLQVSRDPGVPLVYAGFILMILGCWMTFYMPHQQYGVRITAGDRGSRVTVVAGANRNKPAMRNKVKRLAERLQSTIT